MNMASIWKLPILFVVENNQWASATPLMFFQHKRLFRREWHVPADSEFIIPLGRAAVTIKEHRTWNSTS
jgi:hypothetical protein